MSEMGPAGRPGALPHEAAALPAAVLTGGELACGLWFLASPRSTAMAPVWIYPAVAVVWSGLAVQAYARGPAPPLAQIPAEAAAVGHSRR